MTESEKRHRLFREEVITELKEVIERYPNRSAVVNLRAAVLHRTTPEPEWKKPDSKSV